MTEIVFVNPSANMIALSWQLKLRGINVFFVNNNEMISPFINKIHYFFGDGYVTFGSNDKADLKKDDRIFLFKAGILSRLKMLTVRNSLSKINQDLYYGDFNDLVAFKKQIILKPDLSNNHIRSFKTLSDIKNEYRSAKIISSAVKGSGNTTVSIWETNFDYKTVLGHDYFVFIVDKVRFEVFVYEDKFITISKHKDHLDKLKKIIPTIKRYIFTLSSNYLIDQNRSTFIDSSLHSGTILLNDYSFGRNSVMLPSSYYEKASEYIIKKHLSN